MDAVILLVTHGHPTMLRHRHPSLGRLVQPRHYSSVRATADSGIPWAADNDAFVAFDAPAFSRMIDALEGLPGCLFVAAPDVVGDAERTLRLFAYWQPQLAARGLPAALVAQDGLTTLAESWWNDLDALFIGGTTEYKLSEQAAELAAEARARGKWVHMGRVNGARRMRYAASIGCDSVDGSSYARFTRVWLADGIRKAAAPAQMRLVR